MKIERFTADDGLVLDTSRTDRDGDSLVFADCTCPQLPISESNQNAHDVTEALNRLYRKREAQQKATPAKQEQVKPGSLWQLVESGHVYEVLALAYHTEANEDLVIYRRADGSLPHFTAARPLEMFIDGRFEQEELPPAPDLAAPDPLRVPAPDEVAVNMVDTLGKAELEIIATTLIILSSRQKRWLRGFTVEDYKKWCDHKVRHDDIQWLDALATKGYLDKDAAGHYSINLRFVGCLRSAKKGT